MKIRVVLQVMDIKYFKTSNLFGRYNHTIRFTDGVNIIIGDNGVGKTVCLKILNSIFNGDFGYLFNLEFDLITVSFGREIWTISRIETSVKSEMFLFDDSSSLIKVEIKIESNVNGEHIIVEDDVRIDLPSFFEKISDNEWYDRRRGVYIDEKELVNRYKIRTETRGLPLWIRKRLRGMSVRMIDTQRIYRNENNGRRTEIGRTIAKYVKDISNVISEEQNKAGVIASSLDRSFPSRLVSELVTRGNVTTPKDTLDKLIEVDKMNKSLHSVGLTEYKKDSILNGLPQIDSTILTVLSLYADDMKKKLDAYSNIQAKLQLFLSIINSRFANKKCVLNRKGEFSFITEYTTDNARKIKEIEPTLLSSGEQNEFVLFYDLLFNCDEKNLILIDEPELSLHIKWQQMMISDLVTICNHNRLNVLIATHSPDLIGNHWSLVQKLE